MGMSITLRDYLESMGMQFELVEHPRTMCSSETVRVAHIPAAKLAKSVVVEDENGCIAVVVPANLHVGLRVLTKALGRHFCLATEEELIDLFSDCERGAVPAAAQAFGMAVLVDERLLDCDDVYFEAGDHKELVHMSCEEFKSLIAQAGHGRFSLYA